MTTENKAIAHALAKQIRQLEAQGQLDQAEKLRYALEHQLEIETNAPVSDLAEIGQARRNYLWGASLPKQLYQARADLAYAEAQLTAWRTRRNASAIRYWHHQLTRAQFTLAELTAYLAEKRPDILQNESRWKPSALDEHFAPYDDGAADTLH